MTFHALGLALPWLFAFAITFGALESSKVFKDKRINGVIALVIAFLAVTSDAVVTFIYSVVPYAAILFIVVFFLAFILSPLRSKEEKKPDFTLALAILTLGFVWLLQQTGEGVFAGSIILTEEMITLAGAIIVLLMFLLAYKKGAGQGQAPGK